MGEFSLTHLLLLAIVVLIFFGPSRLPALGQSLGKAIRGFKSGLNEINTEFDATAKAPLQATQATLKSNAAGEALLTGHVTEKETQKA